MCICIRKPKVFIRHKGTDVITMEKQRLIWVPTRNLTLRHNKKKKNHCWFTVTLLSMSPQTHAFRTQTYIYIFPQTDAEITLNMANCNSRLVKVEPQPSVQDVQLLTCRRDGWKWSLYIVREREREQLWWQTLRRREKNTKQKKHTQPIPEEQIHLHTEKQDTNLETQHVFRCQLGFHRRCRP